MATKKPKTSNKSTAKAKSTKPKTAAKTVKKPVSEATIAAKTVKKPVSEAPKTNTVEKKEETAASVVSTKPKSCFSNFFAKKYEENESILTIFKNHKFYGSLLGEVVGTLLITIAIFSLTFAGAYDIMRFAGVALIAIYVAIYAFSNACLDPIVTVGMMASRRMSVIRGVMYIIAEIVGAWLGWLIINSFHLAGGETAYDIPALTAVGENQFWLFAMVELLGAIIIAFFYARAIKYKRSVFTFAFTAVGGVVLAFFISYMVSALFLSINNNFVHNPAIALMLQIFPKTGENFGEIFGGVCQALSIYALLPMIGGVAGFYLSDFMSKLSGEE